jgi:hypothetical protein
MKNLIRNSPILKIPFFSFFKTFVIVLCLIQSNGIIAHQNLAACIKNLPSYNMDKIVVNNNQSPNAITQITKVFKLENFEAKRFGEMVLLNWTGELESNFSHYEVERSTDGINYELIENQQSYIENAVHYAVDKSPSTGVNYYRLKQVELDQTYAYSDVKAVEIISNRNDVILFPNPFKEEFTLNGIDKNSEVKVYDIKGNLIFNHLSSDRFLRIDLSSIQSGIYNVISNHQGKLLTNRVIKVN